MYFLVISIILLRYCQISIAITCNVCQCSKIGVIAIDCNGKFIESQINDSNQTSIFLSDDELLDTLILSNNSIIIHDLTNLNRNFKQLKQLKKLDLSLNNLTTFNIEFFSKLSLFKLNLSCNFINSFAEMNMINNESQLTHLDLSYNQLTMLNKTSFQWFPLLQFLNLSFNAIESIDMSTFEYLTHLNTLNLNNNLIKILNVYFPNSLQDLFINNNELILYPLTLSVGLLTIDNHSIENKQLKYLNISGNKLSTLEELKFSELKTLDISYNNFTKIPATINVKNLPSLESLIISGNPIEKLTFNSDMQLKNFVASNIHELKIINGIDFNKLRTYEDECVNITISFNENLDRIDGKFLSNLDVCFLDLSYNNIKSITPAAIKFVNNTLPKYGINLQGNPFNCDCKLQWMLDDLIPTFYKMHSAFLVDLRCQKPDDLFNMRMVHWYNWHSKVFCASHEPIDAFEKITIYENGDEGKMLIPQASKIIIKSSKSAIFLIIGAATLLAVITIIGLVLSDKLLNRRRLRNRRF